MGTGRNRCSPPPVPFSGWFAYPAAFDAGVVARCLAAANVVPGATIIDPLCGSGSVVAAASARGLRAVGLEAHPLIARLAGTKFSRRRDTSVLRADAARIVDGLRPGPVDSEHELLRRCFEGDTLGLLVELRRRIGTSGSRWRGHLETALLAGLRDHASVRVGWAYPQPALARLPRSTDPAGALLERINTMADELDMFPAAWAELGRVSARDARAPFAWRGLVGESEANAAITSPPYFNNYDYLDAMRLEVLLRRRHSRMLRRILGDEWCGHRRVSDAPTKRWLLSENLPVGRGPQQHHARSPVHFVTSVWLAMARRTIASYHSTYSIWVWCSGEWRVCCSQMPRSSW